MFAHAFLYIIYKTIPIYQSEAPDCYAGKRLFLITFSVGQLAPKKDEITYTFCGPHILRCMVVL